MQGCGSEDTPDVLAASEQHEKATVEEHQLPDFSCGPTTLTEMSTPERKEMQRAAVKCVRVAKAAFRAELLAERLAERTNLIAAKKQLKFEERKLKQQTKDTLLKSQLDVVHELKLRKVSRGDTEEYRNYVREVIRVLRCGARNIVNATLLLSE